MAKAVQRQKRDQSGAALRMFKDQQYKKIISLQKHTYFSDYNEEKIVLNSSEETE